MHQKTFSEGGFERYAKRTRREQFLDEMERVVPWARLEALIERAVQSDGQGESSPSEDALPDEDAPSREDAPSSEAAPEVPD